MKRFVLTCLIATIAILASGPETVEARERLYVVSVLPLRPIVAELAGDGARVEALVGPGQSPALFEPTARQLAEVSTARAVFTVGVPFERVFVPRMRGQFPDLRWVDLSEGIETRSLPAMAGADGAETDDGADHGDHRHAAHEPDPHVWLGPVELRSVVDNAARALRELEPGRADAIEATRQAMHRRLEALQVEIEQRLEGLRGHTVLSFHPAFGYFTAHFGIRQLAVESGGAEPGARHLVELASICRDLEVPVLLVQPQFSPARAQSLARTLGVDVLVVDPLAEDVEGTMRALAEGLRAAFAEGGAVRADPDTGDAGREERRR